MVAIPKTAADNAQAGPKTMIAAAAAAAAAAADADAVAGSSTGFGSGSQSSAMTTYYPPPGRRSDGNSDNDNDNDNDNVNETRVSASSSSGHDLEITQALTLFLEHRAAAATTSNPTVSKVESLCVPLQPEHFRQLQELEYCNPEVASICSHIRYNYDSKPGLLSIKEAMPTPLHDGTIVELGRLVQKLLDYITAQGGPAGDFAGRIEPESSTDVDIERRRRRDDNENNNDNAAEVFTVLRIQPDEQFRHERAMLPGLVIEVSVTQKWDDVRTKAERLLSKAKGMIAAVINVDFPDYLHSKEATLTVWRHAARDPKGGWYPRVEQEILSSDGKPAAALAGKPAVSIPLGDFAPSLYGGDEGTDNDNNIMAEVALSLSLDEIARAVAEAQHRADIKADLKKHHSVAYVSDSDGSDGSYSDYY
ncbi:uncharacterized protein E0L32_000948 [Thyridium curvatum]|uniref:Uncharacterized protein n=1 Tax=Thyridium curvatum TaxID=1093900 RepID=A0A507B6U7_9PEZI|nr:uncharacterized protein E0L32_000948 [Thyridium curvatum]TPX12771.1 hypothetical protein E0L32_000948 [Thyridium curvatum]